MLDFKMYGFFVKKSPKLSDATPWSTKNWIIGWTSFLKSNAMTQEWTSVFLSHWWIETPSLTISWRSSDLFTRDAKLKLGEKRGVTPSKLESTTNGLSISWDGISRNSSSKTWGPGFWKEITGRLFCCTAEATTPFPAHCAWFLIVVYPSKNFTCLKRRLCRNICFSFFTTFGQKKYTVE